MNKKNKKQVISMVTIVIMVILTLLGWEWKDNFMPTVNMVNLENLKDVTIKTSKQISKQLQPENKENLMIYFFDVGQADSILVINEEKTMLIDAGNNADGALIVENLKQLGVSKIDYLIGTHPHEDHIGGLDDVIRNFAIETIYMPKVQTNTKTFEDVLDAVIEKNLKIETPSKNDTFQIGKATCKVLAVGENKTNLNLSSIVLKLEFEDICYLFMADAEKEIEDTLEVQKANILKVGHHGSDTSSSQNFIAKVAPEVAVISVGKYNSYKHPNPSVIERLQKIGSKIYRTDEVGNIIIEQRKNV